MKIGYIKVDEITTLLDRVVSLENIEKKEKWIKVNVIATTDNYHESESDYYLVENVETKDRFKVKKTEFYESIEDANI